MRIVKWILIAITALIVTALIAALFVDGKYKVTRSVKIEKSKQEVFDYVKYLKNRLKGQISC
jgi:uncharacterized protein involved in exopolysaccharide biosynthesis